MQLIAKDDEGSFVKLFVHYKDRIYSIAFKLTKSNIIAEEITQDIFLKIWINRKNLIDIQNLEAYLFIVTRNDVYKVLKTIAKNYKIALLDDTHQFLINNETEDYVMQKDCQELLQKAIERLPNQQKKVYFLVKEQGLKRDEVAHKLKIQPDTVKYHLAQAMKNIRTFCLLHLTILVMCINSCLLPSHIR